MRTQVDTTQRKNKSKQSTKVGKDPMQRGLIAIKLQSMIRPKVKELSFATNQVVMKVH